MEDVIIPTRKLPYDLEIEAAVLGTVMLHPSCFVEVLPILNEQSFYLEAHRAIFNAFELISLEDGQIDLITVTNMLRKLNLLDLAKGVVYLTKITQRINSSDHIGRHILILKQYQIKRELIYLAQKIESEAYQETSDAFDLIEEAQNKIFEVSQFKKSSSSEDIHVPVGKNMETIEKRQSLYQDGGKLENPSNCPVIDRQLLGLKVGLYIIAGRPSMGKTAYALYLTKCISGTLKENEYVLFVSLEMSSEQLTMRLQQSESKIDGHKLDTGNLSDKQVELFHRASMEVSNLNIKIDDSAGITSTELAIKAKNLMHKCTVKCIVIDYLQLLGYGQKGLSREQEVSKIARHLKNLSKSMNIPVIALSQLSRAVESRGGSKEPQLSDLRDSGGIEEAADAVFFAFRPDYYGILEDSEGNKLKNDLFILCKKNRLGSLARMHYKFVKELQLITDASNPYEKDWENY